MLADNLLECTTKIYKDKLPEPIPVLFCTDYIYYFHKMLTCAPQITRHNSKTKSKFSFLHSLSLGVHVFQQMYGCEWDDETEEVTGYFQYGYDGEDLLMMDMMENTWITPKQQAVMTKDRWNSNRFLLENDKNYFNQICPAWLKMYVDYGRNLPSVSFLQKSSSSPVSCHATGFYPNRAEMFWRKDGEEVHDGVVKGEILPNNDGTFQMSVDINMSSVAPEDWNKYECVHKQTCNCWSLTWFVFSTANGNKWIIPVAVVALLGLIGVVGFILYKKKKNGKRQIFFSNVFPFLCFNS
uniref:Ig-like domain-containing protein n=1 Tax=Fundulus heteroclitus TaxID=8078 RepID=A0A3Q2QLK1_FUNHE